MILTAKNISKSYDKLQVLKDVSLDVQKGEIISIVGPSGAGKSTLLHIIGTLDKADSGNVEIAGTNIAAIKESELPKFRNQNIGFIFQFHHLLPEFTALENVMIPGLIAKSKDSHVKSKALDLLKLLGLNERINHKPSELSGGEQQRVAVARALINSPSLVFADEPSGNLDSKNAAELHQLFFKLRNDFGHTFVIVTHNAEFAAMADRKIEIKDGVVLD